MLVLHCEFVLIADILTNVGAQSQVKGGVRDRSNLKCVKLERGARPSDPTLAPEVAGPGPAGPCPAQVCRGQLGPLGPADPHPLSHELELGCISVCVSNNKCAPHGMPQEMPKLSFLQTESPLQMTIWVKFQSCYNVTFYNVLS